MVQALSLQDRGPCGVTRLLSHSLSVNTAALFIQLRLLWTERMAMSRPFRSLLRLVDLCLHHGVEWLPIVFIRPLSHDLFTAALRVELLQPAVDPVIATVKRLEHRLFQADFVRQNVEVLAQL